ncbi:MAG TPA: phosphodiester glycosidase family protein [Longimicrobiaceae bacterium]|nr:phosphodiester glycosidase family protein [Longimicrobiaceae bacterium]
MPLRPLHSVVAAFALAGCAPGLAPPAAPAAEAVAGWDRVETVAPGVRHLSRVGGAGPWAVHVVEADPRACGVELGTVKAGGRLEGRETTSELARRAERERRRLVLAALNADFFSFTPPGVPTGAQVVAGEVVRGPGERAVLGITVRGEPFIGRVRLGGKLWLSQGLSATLGKVNTRPTGDTLALYDRFAGAVTPVDTGGVELVGRRVGAAGTGGDTLRGVLVGSDTAAAGVAVPEDGVVFAARGRAADFLRLLTPPGDTVRWTLRFEPVPGPVREMVGGHPVLLRRGAEVPDAGSGAAAAFATARHPRSAVGWRADGTLLLVAVDGRQPGHSVGMSLAEVRSLFRELGAAEALNLDGGGSTALVVRGRVVNRPSDAEGERPVANALVLLGPAPGACGRR